MDVGLSLCLTGLDIPIQQTWRNSAGGKHFRIVAAGLLISVLGVVTNRLIGIGGKEQSSMMANKTRIVVLMVALCALAWSSVKLFAEPICAAATISSIREVTIKPLLLSGRRCIEDSLFSRR